MNAPADDLGVLSALRSLGRRFRILFSDESAWAEFGSGLIILLWAATSIMDNRPLESWPSMKAITDHVPAEVWVSATLILGVSQVVAVLWRHLVLRFGFSFAAASWWGFSGWTFYLSVGASPHITLYIGYVLFCCFAVFKHTLALLQMHARSQRRC